MPDPSPSPAMSWLLDALASPHGDRSAPSDPSSLVRLADHHRVVALLVHRWAEEGTSPPGEIREILRSLASRRAASSLALIALFGSIQRTLEAAGVDCILLKGPGLSLQAFGTPLARQSGDLDILVSQGQRSRAVQALQEAGLQPDLNLTPGQFRQYGKTHHHLGFHTPEGIEIELHWRLHHLRAMPEDYPSCPDRVELPGTSARVLPVTDLWPYLCHHAQGHRWSRLAWIADLDGLARRQNPDWDAIRRRARLLRLERSLRTGIRLVSELLGTPFPDELKTWANADRIAREQALAHEARIRSGLDPTPSEWADLKSYLRGLDSPRDRVRIAARRLFIPTPHDYAAFRLPDALLPAFYFLRPFRLGADLARHIRRGKGKASP